MLTANTILPFIVSFYPLILVISNILDVKLNYPFACILILISIRESFFSNKTKIIISICFLLVFLKYSFYGLYSIKEMVVLLFGPLIFLSFVRAFNNMTERSKAFIYNNIIATAVLVSVIVIGQYLGFLPMTLGRMEFLNVVGMDIWGEYSYDFRPSSYFYHPYDTALAMLPLLAFIGATKKIGKDLLLAASLIVTASLALQLKVFFGFSIFFLLISYFLNVKIPKFVFTLLFFIMCFQVVYLGMSVFEQEDIAYTAGRLLIWKVNLDSFIHDGLFSNLILGLKENPLSYNTLWQTDEFFMTHNIFLFLIVNCGILFFALFLYLNNLCVNIDKNVDKAVLILLITLGTTGDLMVFSQYWVVLCSIYCISQMLQKRNHKPCIKNNQRANEIV